jgi:hypothetical protein
MGRVYGRVFALVVLLGVPAVGHAQRHSAIDLASGALAIDSAPAHALFLGGRFGVDRGVLALDGAGSFALLGTRPALGDAHLTARLAARTGKLHTFLFVTGLAGGLVDHASSWGGRVGIRPRLELGPTHLSLTGALGRLQVGSEWRDVRTIGGELSRHVTGALLTLSAAYTTYTFRGLVTQQHTYYVAGFPFVSRVNVTGDAVTSYFDGGLAVRWWPGRVSLVLATGLQGGQRTPTRPWGRASLEVPMHRGLHLVAQGGWQPAVPERELPSMRIASIGLRLSHAAPARLADTDEAATVLLVEDVPGTHRLRLSGVRADRIALKGDFTQWQPVRLVRLTGTNWELPLAVPAGVHRVCVRIDGGGCEPPPGLPVASDEFQGRVGVLVVP